MYIYEHTCMYTDINIHTHTHTHRYKQSWKLSTGCQLWTKRKIKIFFSTLSESELKDGWVSVFYLSIMNSPHFSFSTYWSSLVCSTFDFRAEWCQTYSINQATDRELRPTNLVSWILSLCPPRFMYVFQRLELWRHDCALISFTNISSFDGGCVCVCVYLHMCSLVFKQLSRVLTTFSKVAFKNMS
jgi:hypothetical protein